MEYQHAWQSVHLVIYQFVWCPKRRRSVLVGVIAERLKQLIEEVAHEQEWQVIQLTIQPDHVHLCLRSNSSTVPSDIPRRMKGRYSHYLRNEFPELRKLPSLWTRSFFVSTAGHVSGETIQRYIAAQ